MLHVLHQVLLGSRLNDFLMPHAALKCVLLKPMHPPPGQGAVEGWLNGCAVPGPSWNACALPGAASGLQQTPALR